MPAAELGTTASQGSPDPHTTGNRRYTLPEQLEAVNDKVGRPCLQTKGGCFLARAGRQGIWHSGKGRGGEADIQPFDAPQSHAAASTTAEGRAVPEDTDAEAIFPGKGESREGTTEALTEKTSDPVPMLRQTPLIFYLPGAEFREVCASSHVFGHVPR